MSQTLTYDNSGTNTSDTYKVYDLDFFPGSVWDLENQEIDRVTLDLEKMTIKVAVSGPPAKIKITQASSDGAVITYTANNSFGVGDVVTITGINPSAFNVENAVVALSTSTSFSIYYPVESLFEYVSGGVASKGKIIKVEGELKTESQNWGSGISLSESNVTIEGEATINFQTVPGNPNPVPVMGTIKVLEVSNLLLNTKYDFRIRVVSNTNSAVYGNYIYATFTTFYPVGENGLARIQSMTNPSLIAPVISDQVVNKNIISSWTPWNYEEEKDFWKNLVPTKPYTESTTGSNTINVGNQKISGSVFTIANPLYKINPVLLCTKLTNIDLESGSPTYDPSLNPPVRKTTYKHFAFGTKMFFTEWQGKMEAPQGGLAFFLSPSGSSGYAIVAKTTESVTKEGSKELAYDVSVVKIESTNKFKRLQDNQGPYSTAFSGITSAEEYAIDVYVDCSDSSTTYIYLYINGRKITAIDSSDPIQPTKTIGLFCMKGECNFDYVYAYPLFQNQFEQITPSYFAATKAPFSALSIAYGEKLINLNSQEYVGYYEEFGPTAKEIMLLEEKFTGPGMPKYLSLGINDLVQVLSQKSNNFGFKAYLINNSSATIPISSEKETISLSMIGNSIIKGEASEYNTDVLNEYINDQPVYLQSSWIQRKTDAEKMANWLKTQWSKNAVFVTMEIFGNPLIAIGDIVTIDYPRSGMNGTDRFLVTKVEQTFDGGLETKLECRRINAYS